MEAPITCQRSLGLGGRRPSKQSAPLIVLNLIGEPTRPWPMGYGTLDLRNVLSLAETEGALCRRLCLLIHTEQVRIHTCACMRTDICIKTEILIHVYLTSLCSSVYVFTSVRRLSLSLSLHDCMSVGVGALHEVGDQSSEICRSSYRSED